MRPTESYRAYRKVHGNGPYEGKWDIRSRAFMESGKRYSGGSRQRQKSKYRFAHDGGGGFVKSPSRQTLTAGIGMTAALAMTQSFVKALMFIGGMRGRR